MIFFVVDYSRHTETVTYQPIVTNILNREGATYRNTDHIILGSEVLNRIPFIAYNVSC